MRLVLFLLALLIAAPAPASAQAQAPAHVEAVVLLRPDSVFDGVEPRPHAGWSVLVRGNRIAAAGPDLVAPDGATILDLPGLTLMPGMIEGHAHLFLHPYD